MNKTYDVFISHASEDKDAVVRPLATILERLSVKVWYDEFALHLGDSLTASIDKGLRESRFGLLVLSKSFLGKNWPDYEYRSFLTRQIGNEKVILPLWYNITQDEVKGYSLYLADIKALSIRGDNIKRVIPEILKVVRPDIFKEMTMRSMLRKMVREGESLVVNCSEIQVATEKQSRLTPQQYIRSKAIYYGIGRHLNVSLQEYRDIYELDVVPERELQMWEIMNVCYLEMLERHPNATKTDRRIFFKIIVDISLGGYNLQQSDVVRELIDLWNNNYYDF